MLSVQEYQHFRTYFLPRDAMLAEHGMCHVPVYVRLPVQAGIASRQLQSIIVLQLESS